jgi:hypothetical protein
MRHITLFLVGILLVSFTACRHREKKLGEINSLSDLKDYAENITEQTKKSQDRAEERRKKGDTLAIAYKDLEAYLPEISGYTSEHGPKGSQMNTPGLGSWSQAEQEYSSGDKRVDVSIMDYNAAQQAFLGLTSMLALGISSEDDNKKQGSVDLGIKDVKAYETIYKKDKRSELALIVADRFVINLKSDGENDENFLRSVAKDMKLDELASK